MRRFLFALAGHLGMTVAELCQRMDSRELSEWMAYTRYFQALPDPWAQTGLLASVTLAPHSGDKTPKPKAFIPVENPPQHESQDYAALMKLKAELGG